MFSDSTAIKPLFNSKKCIVTSQGIYPNYSNLDSYKMAACCIDTAVRNLVVTGCNLSNIALLDNLSNGRVEACIWRGIYGREALNMNADADMKDQAKNFRLFEEIYFNIFNNIKLFY